MGILGPCSSCNSLSCVPPYGVIPLPLSPPYQPSQVDCTIDKLPPPSLVYYSKDTHEKPPILFPMLIFPCVLARFYGCYSSL